MKKYRVESRHPNPAYLPRYNWFDTESDAKAFIESEENNPKSLSALHNMSTFEITDAMYKEIKKQLTEYEQFCGMIDNEQMEDIYKCYQYMMKSIGTFADNRYDY
jgi:hypothetical protein